MPKPSRILAAALVLAATAVPLSSGMAGLAPQGSVAAHEWGETRFGVDPRFNKIRERIKSVGGDLRPLTFAVRTRGLGGKNEFNAIPITQQFISELGGTPVRQYEQFEIVFDRADFEDPSGYKVDSDYFVKIVDVQANGQPAIAVANIQFNCAGRSRCDLPRDVIRELLLRLGQ